MLIRGRTLDMGFAVLAAAQLGAAALLVPSGDSLALPGGAPLGGMCWWHALFHFDCPMCGMTRSFVAFAHGHLRAALDFHPAGPLLFVAMLVFLGAVVTVTARRAQPLFERRNFRFAFDTVVLVCLAMGIFKMVRS
ncbi:MAG: hypothetical protein JWO36_7187 [Myxococcales bacterium]|nr:hypothetical protein [Myxococcales bacterium]